MSQYIKETLDLLKKRNPGEDQFLRQAEETLDSIGPVIEERPDIRAMAILERFFEPERIIIFRVPWEDDEGRILVQRGYRVQFSSALGPFKGGLRFHPSVNIDIFKSLALEQTFKNSLTDLPLGAGKGGSDFNPKGRTDREVMRFCQSFMDELFRHIGPDTDVPAGDMGVGTREIGYLFGRYRRIRNEFEGVLTGKKPRWGGSCLREEATGYGVVYFAREILRADDESIEGKRCIVSGAGNVAIHCAEKLAHLGAVPITLSDSAGVVHDPAGFNEEKIAWVKKRKLIQRGSLEEYPDHFSGAEFIERESSSDDDPIWRIEAECAFPCATHGEVAAPEAKRLIEGGCRLVCEGANMPCAPDAVAALVEAGVRFAPGKAANAGGVAVSHMEMAQNSMRLRWTPERVDEELQGVMGRIHREFAEAASHHGKKGDLRAGANIAGFLRVAEAMLEQGVV